MEGCISQLSTEMMAHTKTLTGNIDAVLVNILLYINNLY
jgi:hypothetical protein